MGELSLLIENHLVTWNGSATFNISWIGGHGNGKDVHCFTHYGTLVNYQQFRASILSDAIALRDLIQLKYHAILAGQEIGCDANTMENYYDVNKIVVEYGGKSQDIETNKEEQYQWKHPE